MGTTRTSSKTFSRRISALLCAAAIAGTTLTGAGAAQAACATGVEAGTVAKSVRTLQSDMMVAALSCEQRDLYNGFVTRYRQDLVRNGKALKLHFKRAHSGGHSQALNSFVTELANDAAIRHARTGSAYCTASREMMLELLDGGTQTEIDVYALRYAIGVRPQLAQEIATAAGPAEGCDEAVALNLPE